MTAKKLPIQTPLALAYPQHSFLLAILANYEQCLPWVYSNFIQLSCNTSKGMHRDWFDYYVPDALDHSNPWFYRTFFKLPRDMIATFGSSPSELVRNAIDRDYYVIPHIDEKVLPISYAYGKEDVEMPHSILIYGYDAGKRLFHTMGFYKFHEFVKYQSADITFEQFEEAYREAGKWAENGIPGHPKFDPREYDYMPTMHVAKFNPRGQCPMDVDVLIEQLEDYVHARNSSRKYALLQPERAGVFGLDVYAAMQQFLQRVIDMEASERRPYFDPRPYYILWEHKQIMGKRLNYLQREGFLEDASAWIGEYARIEAEAASVQNAWIKFLLMTEGRDDRLVQGMIATLGKMVGMEKAVLEQLILALRAVKRGQAEQAVTG